MIRNRSAYRLVLLSIVLSLMVASPALAGADTTATATFSTPGPSSFTVPVGVTSLAVTAIGARGGEGCFGGLGGEGAVISGTIPVSSGQMVSIMVGGVGGGTGGCQPGVPMSGGIGGGGGGGSEGGGGGGGRSSVSIGPFAPGIGTVLLVAGGGGGAGDDNAAGGSAGTQGTASAGAAGGTAGTGTEGGRGGLTGSCAGRVNGGPGGFATGGSGASPTIGGGSTGGGGGGGGGYYGGGGGAGCPGPFVSEGGGGGGGGGGSSHAGSSVTGVSGPVTTKSSASVTITYDAPAATLSGPGLAGGAFDFATQAEGTVGSAEPLTLTNTGSAPLVVSGLTLSGPNPDDYLLGNRCQQPLPPTPGFNSCQVSVRFAPQATGPSSAKLAIDSNSAGGELDVALSGTGGGLPQGAAGPAGPTGPTGPVELVTCKAKKVKGTHGGKAKTVQDCTAKVVSGPVTFKTATAARARLSRDGRVVAVGEERRGELTFDSHRLRPGRYMLTLVYRRGNRLVDRHRSILLSD